jgi:hypothetical protein
MTVDATSHFPSAGAAHHSDSANGARTSKAVLERELRAAVHGDPFLDAYLTHGEAAPGVQFMLHLAILTEPFLGYLLDGRKTVESRFSSRRFAPYGKVARGDVLLLKRSGGPIVGLCWVANIWFYHLDPRSWRSIKEEFTAALCAQDPAFWRQRASASFASLMRVEHVRALKPIRYPKRDRRGWVVLGSMPARPGVSV